jgi:glutathione S-transferase
MAPDRGILPRDLVARADAMGTLELIAGEDGLGWNARLAMIDASFASGGTAGFPEMIAKFLAKRYGYTRGCIDAARERMKAQFELLASKLHGDYFGGGTPNAVDIYNATFLTPVAAPLSEAECPAIVPPMRAAFASAHAAIGPLVPAALLAHRERMFERHLPRPIVL